MRRPKSEVIRRLRLGDLQKILRFRYGHTLPDDDAGREDLFELLLPISLGQEERRKMMNAIEVNAPWMDADETMQLIDQINRMPSYERKRTARRQGEIMRISKAEREVLKLKTIAPFDMTDEQLAEQRKEKDRDRKRRQSRAAGRKPHDQSFARKKPWEKAGLSRRTWFRKRARLSGTNLSRVKLTYTPDKSVPLGNVECPKRPPRKTGQKKREAV
jgi:hypothetical protein